jgi:hypothetical protein
MTNPAFLRMVQAEDQTRELLGRVENLYGIIIPREIIQRGKKIILKIPNANLLSIDFPIIMEITGTPKKVCQRVWRTIVKPLIQFP